ncbi:MAG: TolC family protein [Rhodocyclaceae bacterium]|nr:TolC family protein [Rhodocyclaceae bacterium]
MSLLLLLPLTAAAVDFTDLPPAAQVAQALRTYPLVRAAEAGLRVEAANRDRLAAGPHEFALRLASQRRNERATDSNTRDHEIGIERAIRLPGKSARDAEIGAAGVAQAQFALGDALHESARLLLKSWFDWLREGAAARDWAAQVAVLRTQHAAILKKVGAGETAKLEALLSEAQLVQAEAQQIQAQARRTRAANELAQHFPGITLPEALVPSSPQTVADSPAQWRERILAHNHELAVARAAARRATLLARQLDAERMPDPTLGLKLASERDGQDRIIGLQLSIPLPGAARAASARAGTAEADAAYAREALALARAEAEARRTVSLAQGAHATWRLLADVAARMEDNARLLEKAWRLGEGQFGELQTARRQAIEARLAATQAQLDANEARYRLLLDAHELWPLDDDGD